MNISTFFRCKGNEEAEAFRPVFSRIGELRSVRPNVPILALIDTSGSSQTENNEVTLFPS